LPKDLSTTIRRAFLARTAPAACQCIWSIGYVWQTTGENIASGQTRVAQVMSAWMNSSCHKANILGDSFTEFGGAARVGNYWTQVFAAPLGGGG